MNKQQIFDEVASFLLKQGRSATANNHGQCVYRGEGGVKCAAGCLIPDDLYSSNMEGKTILNLVDDGEFNLPTWMKEEKLFLSEMQNAHDYTLIRGVSPWIDRMIAVAHEYGLKTDVLKNR